LDLFLTGKLQWLTVLLINRIISKHNAVLYVGSKGFPSHGAPPFAHESFKKLTINQVTVMYLNTAFFLI